MPRTGTKEVVAFSTGWWLQPVLKGGGVFSTGWSHQPVLKVRHNPILMSAARLAVGTGTNGHISAGSNTNRD